MSARLKFQVMHSIQNNRGFELISVLIASFCVGAVSLALLAVVDVYQRGEASTTSRLSRKNYVQQINNVLSDPAQCKKAFTDPTSGATPVVIGTPGPSPIPNSYVIYDPQFPGENLVDTTSKIEGYKINKVYFSPLSAFVDPSAFRVGKLNLEFKKNSNSDAFGPDVIVESLDFVFKTTAAGSILTCSSDRKFDTSTYRYNGMTNCKKDENCGGLPQLCWGAIAWECEQHKNTYNPAWTKSATDPDCAERSIVVDTYGNDRFPSDNLCTAVSGCTANIIYWSQLYNVWYYGNSYTMKVALTGDYICTKGIDMMPKSF